VSPSCPSPLFVRTQALTGLPARAALALIRLYQRTLSPALPALFGSACGCRFYPTCSHYAAEAIRTHGLLAGVLLGAIRLVKCTPLHPGGFDPVPRRRALPHCQRTA
jgi:putative membrane protein insertion efficiency factor